MRARTHRFRACMICQCLHDLVARSYEVAIVGAETLKWTERSRRAGKIRSRQILSARMSPSSARSIALRVSASAWPSSSASAATVALFRAPLGRPALPGLNGRPRVFVAFFLSVSVIARRLLVKQSHQDIYALCGFGPIDLKILRVTDSCAREPIASAPA